MKLKNNIRIDKKEDKRLVQQIDGIRKILIIMEKMIFRNFNKVNEF